MELEVRHLRALCAIADAGSLHKAARQLGMSQPSLT
ncbi:helix-turn-helix domain-containing protein, partial [Streptomyces niveus]